MARIGLLVPPWTGHLNPMTTLGAELRRRGHDVAVISVPDAEAAVALRGLELVPLGTGEFPAGEWPRLALGLSRLSRLRAAHFTVRWLARITRVVLDELPDVLREGAFDGVIADQICFGAECAVAAAGVPLVIACNALPVHFQPDIPPHTETWPWRTDAVGLARNWLAQRALMVLARPVLGPVRTAVRRKGERWDPWRQLNEVPPSLAHIAQLPECFDFPRRHAPEHFHHTGPWHESADADSSGFDWERLDGRPLVYASLGTLQNGPEQPFQTILDACAELPVQIVLALGREDGPMPERVPSNAVVVGWAPQLALLRRAALVITHAGLNTTLEALARGVPLVALPLGNDQPGIAARIRHAGVGDWISPRRLSAKRLRDVVRRVSSDATYRDRARDVAERIARADGLRRAADIAERALIERRRTTRDEVSSSD